MWLRLIKLQLWREKGNREFRVLMLALGLAVFSVTTISCITLSLGRAVTQDASVLLGADLIVEASHPLPSSLQTFAVQQKLTTTNIIEFFSMVSTPENMQLASIAAIDEPYPLRGKLTVNNARGSNQIQYAPPSQHHVWIEENLALKLNVKLQDEVQIGAAKFTVDAIILSRPVATSDTNILAPIAYINASDLAKMNVIQAGSRASYRLLLAGDSEKLNQFRSEFEKNIATDIGWITPESGRQTISRTIHYMQRYLSVILLIQVFLGGVAIAMCAHQYSTRQQKVVATWRCIGASSKVSVGVQLLSLMILATLICFISIGLGYIAVKVLVFYAKSMGMELSSIPWQGGLLGAATGLIMMLGFALPPFYELRKITPIQIFQQTGLLAIKWNLLSYLIAGAALSGLFYFYIGELDVALRLGMQIVGMGAVVYLVAWGTWFIFKPLSAYGPLAWRFAMNYLLRHKWQVILQWLVFTIVIMLLLLVQIFQKDFIRSWQKQLPQSTPNYFLLNIQSSKIALLQQWFHHHGVQSEQFYPIVRARMTQVNGVSVDLPNNAQQQRARGLQRPINLTWCKTLPLDNQVIAGQDWGEVQPGQAFISVEKGFADRQFLKLGDTIDFQIAEQKLTGKIIQFRTVEWESLKPNFFVFFPPGVLEQFPHDYITSFYLPKSQKKLLLVLAKDFVEISIIDIEALLENVRQTVAKISMALNVTLGMVFIFGLLIMVANLLATLKERQQEGSLMRILGATRMFIAKVLLIEFAVLAFFAGVVASVLAIMIAQDLAQRIFSVPFLFSVKWLIIGIAMSFMIIPAFGVIGARSIITVTFLKR